MGNRSSPDPYRVWLCANMLLVLVASSFAQSVNLTTVTTPTTDGTNTSTDTTSPTSTPLVDYVAIAAEMSQAYVNGCQVEMGKALLSGSAHKIIEAVGASGDNLKSLCRESKAMFTRFNNVTEGCPSPDTQNWGFLQTWQPYKSLIQAITSNVCHYEGEEDADPKTCPNVFRTCFMAFVSVMVDGSHPSMCWTAQQARNCIVSALKECKEKRVTNVARLITDQLSLTVDAYCPKPKECSSETAMNCLIEAKTLANSMPSEFSKSPMMCSALEMVAECVKVNIMSCDDGVLQYFSKPLLHIHMTMKSVCPREMDFDIPDKPLFQAIMATKIAADSPFLSQKSFCTMMKNAIGQTLMDQYHRLDTILKTRLLIRQLVGDYCDGEFLMMKQEELEYGLAMDPCESWPDEPQCNVAAAEQCVDAEDFLFLVSSVDMLGKNTVCTEAHKIAWCANAHLSGCNMMQLPGQNFSLWHLMGQVATYCPIQSLLLGSFCEKNRRCEALSVPDKCLLPYNKTQLENGQACSLAKHALDCYEEHTKGCVSADSVIPSSVLFHFYMEALEPYCFIPPMQFSQGPFTSMKGSAQKSKVVGSILRLLQVGSNATHDLCHALMISKSYVASMWNLTLEEERMKFPFSNFETSMEMELQKELWMKFCTYNDPKTAYANASTSLPAEPETTGTCKPIDASMATAWYFGYFLSYPGLSVLEKRSVCSDEMFHGIMMYVSQQLQNCTSARQSVFHEILNVVQSMKLMICSVNPFAALMYKPNPSECAIDAATNCIHWYSGAFPLLSGYETAGNCEVTYWMLSCVKNATMQCNANELAPLQAVLEPIIGMTATSCLPLVSPDNCNSTVTFLNMVDREACDYQQAVSCMDMFESASPLMLGNTEFLCSSARQMKNCVNYYGNSCNQANITNAQTRLSSIMATHQLTQICSDHAIYDTVGSCGKTVDFPACNMNIEPCFADPSVLCNNSSMVSHCIELQMLGCDVGSKLIAYDHMTPLQDLYELMNQQTCNFVPSIPASKLSDIKYVINTSCQVGDTVLKDYLQNPGNVTEKDLCDAFDQMKNCVMAPGWDTLPPLMRSFMMNLYNSIDTQYQLRCASLENQLDLIYENENIEAIGAGCQTGMMAASSCMSSYIGVKLWIGMIPLHERMEACSKSIPLIMCINEHTKSCPHFVRERFNRVTEWVDAIGNAAGGCNYKMETCDPEGVADALSNIAMAITMYDGGDMESAICTRGVAMFNNVRRMIAKCPAVVRLNLEHSYSLLEKITTKICVDDDDLGETPEICDKEKPVCNMPEAGRTIKTMIDLGWEAILMKEKQYENCMEMGNLYKTMEMHSSSCTDMDLVINHMPILSILTAAACSKTPVELEEELSEEEHMCIKTVSSCMDDFLSISTQGNLLYMCNQAHLTKKCLEGIEWSCPKSIKDLKAVSHQQISMVEERICSNDRCNLMVAKQCMQKAGELLYVAADRLEDSQALCSGMQGYLNCVMEYTAHCDLTSMPVEVKQFEYMKIVTDDLCKTFTPNMILIYSRQIAGIMSLVALSASPFVTNESLCPQAQALQMHLGLMEIEMSYTEREQLANIMYIPNRIIGEFCFKNSNPSKESCSPAKLQSCFNKNAFLMQMKMIPLLGWSPICKMVESTMCCLAQGATPCWSDFDSMSQYAGATLKELMTLVGDNCPMEEVYENVGRDCDMSKGPLSCRTAETAMCFPDVLTENRADVCGKMETIIACIRQHTMGCSSLQLMTINFAIERLYNWTQPCYTLVAIDMKLRPLVMDRVSFNVFNMADMYLRKTAEILQYGNNFKRDVCLSLMAMRQYMGQFSGMMVIDYFNERQAKHINEFCGEELKNMSQCPPTSNWTVSSTNSSCVSSCSSDEMCGMGYKCCYSGCSYSCMTAVSPNTSVIPTSKRQAEPGNCMIGMASTYLATYLSELSWMNVYDISERETYCSSYWYIVHMIEGMLVNCSDASKKVFMDANEMVKGMISITCQKYPIEYLPMANTTCAPELADECMQWFSMEMNEMPVKGEYSICNKFVDSLHCMKKTLIGCDNSTQMERVQRIQPMISLLANTCPLAMSINCNMSAWMKSLDVARCNMTMIEDQLKVFDEFAVKNAENRQAVCSEFERMSYQVAYSGFLCDEKSEDMQSILFSTMVMYNTYGMKCFLDGYFSPPFAAAVVSETQCVGKPRCSFMWDECFESWDPTDICSDNGEAVKMCLSTKMSGCDPVLSNRVMYTITLTTQLVMNLPCNVIPDSFDPVANKDECLYNLTMSMGDVVEHAKSGIETEQGICGAFRSFSQCTEMSLDSMSLVWKGLEMKMLERVHEYTDVRCRMTEAVRRNMDMSTGGQMNGSSTVITTNSSNSSVPSSSYNELPQCNIQSINAILFQYMLSTLYGGHHPIEDRSAMCKTRALMSYTIQQATLYCSTKRRVHVFRIMEWLNSLAGSDGICPHMDPITGEVIPAMDAECDIEEAMREIGMVSKAIVYHADGKYKNAFAVCSNSQIVGERVLKMVWGCDSFRRSQVEQALMDQFVLSGLICGAPEINEDQKIMDELGVKNWMSYYQGTNFTNASNPNMDLFCPMEMDEEDNSEKTCKIDEALHCIAFARERISLLQTDENICRVAVGVKNCVMRNLYGCSQERKDGVMVTLQSMMSQVNCKDLKCELCRARQCIQELKDTISSGEATCVDVWKTKACVDKSLDNCHFFDGEAMGISSELTAFMYMNVSNEVCDQPYINTQECLSVLTVMTTEILEMGDVVKELFADKSQSDISVTNATTDGQGNNTTNSTRVKRETEPATAPLIYNTGSDDLHAMIMDRMEGLTKALIQFVADKDYEASCDRLKPLEGLTEMQSKCKRIKMAWHCVKIKLETTFYIPDDMKETVEFLLEIIGRAVMERCSKETQENNLRCFSCSNAKTDAECNMKMQEVCQGEHQSCYTVMDKGLISKGCFNRKPMLSEKQCVRNGTKCMSYCDLPLCNEHVNWTHSDPPTCQMQHAMTCALLLTNGLMTKGHDCRQTQEAIHCIYVNTKDCIHHSAGLIVKEIEKFKRSRTMMKCYMKEEDCFGGSCETVTFTKTLQNPLITNAERCLLAYKSRKNIINTMLQQDISAPDLLKLYGNVYGVRMLMSDNMCDQSSFQPTFFGQCSEEGADVCVEESFLNIYLQNMNSTSIPTQHLCMLALKTFSCVNYHTVNCDADKANAIAMKYSDIIGMMSAMCDMPIDLSKGFNQMMNESYTLRQYLLLDHTAIFSGQDGDRLKLMGSIMETLYKGIPGTVCKPSIAVQACFNPVMDTLLAADPNSDDYCRILDRIKFCMDSFMGSCSPPQRAAVDYSFSLMVQRTGGFCSYYQYGDPDIFIREVLYEDMFTLCVYNYTTALFSNPSHMCELSQRLLSCVSHLQVYEVGRYMKANAIQTITSLMQYSCENRMENGSDTSSDPCLMNVTQACSAPLIMRVLVCPVLPLYENINTCWDVHGVESCIQTMAAKRNCASSASTPLSGIGDALVEFTREGCNSIAPNMNTSCSKAKECVEHMLVSLLSTDLKDYDGNSVCFRLERTLECVLGSVDSCSPGEMQDVQDGLIIIGNMTSSYCPHLTSFVCSVRENNPKKDPNVQCNLPALDSCVTSFFDGADKLTNDTYCSSYKEATNCISQKSVSCPLYKVDVFYQRLQYGMMKMGRQCGTPVSLYSAQCPIYTQCPMTELGEKLNALQITIANSSTAAVSCSAIKETMDYFITVGTGCHSMQVAILNNMIEFMLQANNLGSTCEGVKTMTSYDKSMPILSSLAQCGTVFAKRLEGVVYSPKQGFLDMCSAAEAFTSCMSTALNQTDNIQTRFIKMVFSSTLMTLNKFTDDHCSTIDKKYAYVNVTSPTLPPNCHATMAYGCMSWMAQKSLFMAASSWDDMVGLCMEVTPITTCVENYTMNCPEVVTDQLKTITFLLGNLVMDSGACPYDQVQNWMMHNRMFAITSDGTPDGLIATMGQPLTALQRAVAAGAKEWEEANLPGLAMNDDSVADNTTEMDEDVSMDNCNLREAMECGLKLTTDFSSNAEIMLNPSGFCRSLADVFICMAKHYEGCNSEVKFMLQSEHKELIYYFRLLQCSMNMTLEGMDPMITRWLDTPPAAARYATVTNVGMKIEANKVDRLSNMPFQAKRLLQMLMDKMDGKDLDWDRDEVIIENIMDNMEEGNMEDCIEEDKYKEHAMCRPSTTIQCLVAVLDEAMDPYSSNERLCMKVAVATRCYLLTLNQCEWATEDIVEQLGNYTLAVIQGAQCPTHVSMNCEARREAMCTEETVASCYAPLKPAVVAILSGHKENSLERICSALEEGFACDMELVESGRCPKKTLYRAYSGMDPLLGKAIQMCSKIPLQGCVANAMWKMSAIYMLNAEMYKISAYKHVLESYLPSSDKMDSNTMKNMTAMDILGYMEMMNEKNMAGDRDSVPGPKEVAKALMTFQTLTGKTRKQCNEEARMDKHEDLVEGIMYLNRYAMMYQNIVERDQRFMNMFTLTIASQIKEDISDDLGRDQSIDNLVRMILGKLKDGMMNSTSGNMTNTVTDRTNKTMGGINDTTTKDTNMTNNNMTNDSLAWLMENVDLEDVIGKVIYHMLTYADSHVMLMESVDDMVSAVFHQSVVTMKEQGDDIGEFEDMIDKVKENAPKQMESKAKEQLGRVFDAVMTVMKMEKSNMSIEEGVEFLHQAQQMQMLRKADLCLDLTEAAKCTETFMSSAHSKIIPPLKSALESLFSIISHICMPTKCYQCEDVHSNEKCNEQGLATCESGEVCFTEVRSGKISKGCAAVQSRDTPEGDMYLQCYSSECNSPKFTAMNDNITSTCNPTVAIGCMYEILPQLISTDKMSEYQVQKHLSCMQSATYTCQMEENRALYILGRNLQQQTLAGSCSGPSMEYDCGARAVIDLAGIVQDTMANRERICHALNVTLMTFAGGVATNSCTEYDMAMMHSNLNTIFKIIGPDFCPGIEYKADEQVCNVNYGSQRCELENVPYCYANLTIATDYYAKVSGEAQDMRTMDQFCQIVSAAYHCVGYLTDGCDGAVKKQALEGAVKRLEMYIPMCPILEMNRAVCSTEEQPETCDVSSAMNDCLQPAYYFTHPNAICNLTETDVDGAMKCIEQKVPGCTSAQSAIVVFRMSTYMAMRAVRCNNYSANINETQKLAATEMAEQFIFHTLYGDGTKDYTNKPIQKHLNNLITIVALNSKVGNKTLNFMQNLKNILENNTQTIADPALNRMISTMKDIVDYYHMESMFTKDNTIGVARCVGEYSSGLLRALSYPLAYTALSCEAGYSYLKCLKKLDLNEVERYMVVSTIARNEYELDSSCHNYVDTLVYVGQLINNQTETLQKLTNESSMPVPAEYRTTVDLLRSLSRMQNQTTTGNYTMTPMSIETILEHMNITSDAMFDVLKTVLGPVMGSVFENVGCNTFMIADYLASITLTLEIGGLNSYNFWTKGVCPDIIYAPVMLLPEIDKCREDVKDIYNMIFSYYEYKLQLCRNPAYSPEPTADCRPDIASGCLADVSTYLSTSHNDVVDLCSRMEKALLCANMSLSSCPSDNTEYTLLNVLISNFKSVMGDRCPYIRAMESCPSAVAVAPTLCNTSEVESMSCLDLITDKVGMDRCSGLVDLSKCVTIQLASCSGDVARKAIEKYELHLKETKKMCLSEDSRNNFLQKNPCAKAATCSAAGLANCFDVTLPKTDSCSDWTSIQSCVLKQIEGCKPLQLIPFRAIVDQFVAPMNASKCFSNVRPQTFDMMENIILSSVENCVANFSRKLINAVISPENTPTDMCVAYYDMQQCLFQTSDRETIKQFIKFLGVAFARFDDIMDDICGSPDVLPEIMKYYMGQSDLKLMQSVPIEEPRAGCNLSKAAECMSSLAVSTVLSGTFRAEDKDVFCNKNHPLYGELRQCVRRNTQQCAIESLSSLNRLEAIVNASKPSTCLGAMTCDYNKALACGDRVAEYMIRMKSNDTCRAINETGVEECMINNMFGCPYEVRMALINDIYRTDCVWFDSLKTCPGTIAQREMASFEIPECDWMDYPAEYKTCDLDMASSCAMNMINALYNPVMDCSKMNRPYVDSLKCMDYYTGGCDPRSGVMYFVEIIGTYLIGLTNAFCPSVVGHPCKEKESCRYDEAKYCVDVLEYVVAENKVDRAHTCLMKGMAHQCAADRLRDCSPIAKTHIMSLLKNAPKDGVDCGDDLELCITRFLYSAVGIIEGDVMYANMLKVRNEVAGKVTTYILQNPDKATLDKIDEAVDYTVGQMQGVINESMTSVLARMAMDANVDQKEIHSLLLMNNVTMYIWDIMTGGRDEEYDVTHRKSKAIQCGMLQQAFDCVQADDNMVEWMYMPVAIKEGAMGAMSVIHNVSASICPMDTSCMFMEEPAECHIPEAAWLSIGVIGDMMANKTKFCSEIEMKVTTIKAITKECSADTRMTFELLEEIFRKTATLSCGTQLQCDTVAAETCLKTFSASADKCKGYDDALACLTAVSQGCSPAMTSNWTSTLQKTYEPYEQTCVVFPDLKLSNSTLSPIYLREGASTSLDVKMDTTDGCTGQCYVEVSLRLNQKTPLKCPDGSNIPQMMVVTDNFDQQNVCTLKFTSSETGVTKKLPIVATLDRRLDGSQNATATIIASKFLNPNTSAERERQLGVYQLFSNDVDSNSAICSSTGTHPRIKTFDSASIAYTNTKAGFFKLFESTAYPFQVWTANFRRGDRGLYYTCMVTITNGRSIVVIDVCKYRQGIRASLTNRLLLESGSQLPAGSKIYRSGTDMEVVLPSGTIVRINKESLPATQSAEILDYLNIYITPSPLDLGSTSGLCGLYDNNPDNDRVGGNGRGQGSSNAALNSFRTYNSADLFGGIGDLKNFKFCSCSGSASNQCVTEPFPLMRCANTKWNDITNTISTSTFAGGNRRKRQTTTNDPFGDIFNNVVDETTDTAPPTFGQITEQEATDYCTTEITNNQLVKDCETATGNDYSQTLIDTCIENIKITDKKEGSVDLSYIETVCPAAVANTDNVDSTLSEQILKATCPNDCSSHGVCSDGTCTCNSGFFGQDCSIALNAPPTLVSVAGSGQCDITSGTCATVTVIGSGFFNSDTTNPKCVFVPVEITDTVVPDNSKKSQVDATVVSSEEVVCTIPSAMTANQHKWAVQVSVSNNEGNNPSSPQTYVAFNPKCYSCSSSSCQLSGCLIGDKCYEDNEDKADDVCMYCDNTVSDTTWTRKIGGTACKSDSTNAPVTDTTQTEVTSTEPTKQTTTTPSTTKAPEKTTGDDGIGERERIIIVVVAVVAGAFAVLSCILAVKLCQRVQDPSFKRYSGRDSPSDEGNSSFGAGQREYDNLAYDNYTKSPQGSVSTFRPPAQEAGYASAYPSKVVSVSEMDEPATKL